MYDVIVLGGGIAGASFASFASLNKKRVLLLDSGFIKDNASVAAGAFLSPKFGPKSNYNDFINRAFSYSIDFYKKQYSEFLNNSGMLRLAKNEQEEPTCEEYMKNSSFWKKSKFNNKVGYFCKEAAIIEPLPTLLKMLKNCDFKENVENIRFSYKNNNWHVNEFCAKHLVLATGSRLLIKNEPYIKVKPIFGQKIEASTKPLTHNFSIHRQCSISPYKDDKIFIGATHIPSWRYQEDENLFEQHRQKLIEEAKFLLQGNIDILSISSGFRSSTTDYFPLCGKIIKMQETLNKFPLLRHGVMVDESKFLYYKNLWLHTGHGARGFVLAPYTSRELYCQMFFPEDTKELEITLKRQLIRYLRRVK